LTSELKSERTLRVFSFHKKLARFGSVCMRRNSKSSRRHKRRILPPISSRHSWELSLTRLRGTPSIHSVVRTVVLVSSSTILGTTNSSSSARKSRMRRPQLASRT
jgi:hypothetical protein